MVVVYCHDGLSCNVMLLVRCRQNHDYVIISGARRKEQRWDPHENEQIVPEGRCCISFLLCTDSLLSVYT